MATIKLRGWFKPQMAAQINQRDDGYYVGPGDKTPLLNGVAIPGRLASRMAICWKFAAFA